jgi:(heptosyl)LPS beta-1,4-glucosyltransferase
MPLPISACIMCKNEAPTITAALDSLAWADEIIVVDSGSTDGTLSLITNHPAKPRLIHHDWPGYNAQRQFMVAAAKHDWVFMLDADEECTPELSAALKKVEPADVEKIAMVEMPRRNYLMRRYARAWSPDPQGRLIHRSRIIWNRLSQFDAWKIADGYGVKRINHPLLHNPKTPPKMTDFNDGPLMAERAALMADHLYHRGRRASLLQLLTRPVLTFFKFYVLRGGFLEGRFGLAVAYKTTIGVMLKYSVLYWREQAEKERPK